MHSCDIGVIAADDRGRQLRARFSFGNASPGLPRKKSWASYRRKPSMQSDRP
jgi:hypothetical protein